ncbi:MAG TPA: DinB family protein [Chloroflexia bacterium]|nr:DinB family protein [Chloroflexia bacterium]
MDTANPKEENMVVDLFRHNTWANMKLLEACEGLGDEHLGANMAGTFGAIRDTLIHIVGAEVSYVKRVTGRMPEEPLKRGELPSFEVMKKAARWTGEELLQLALKAGPTDMVLETGEGGSVKYPLTSLLTQAINHATEHRAQVATILTQQGIEPPDMSGWAYMEEMGQFEETVNEKATD